VELSRPVELNGEAPPHKVVWITPMPGEETASGNGPEPLAATMPCCGRPPAVGWDGVSCESPGGTPTGSVSGGVSDVVSSGPVAGSDPEESSLPSVGAESGGVVSGSGGGVVVSESGGGVVVSESGGGVVVSESGGGVVVSESGGGVVVSESEGGVVAGDSTGVVVPELSEVPVSTVTPTVDSLELDSAVVSLAWARSA
jgi:hypothetical protein